MMNYRRRKRSLRLQLWLKLSMLRRALEQKDNRKMLFA